jgi:hypothetical protein
LQCSKGTAGTVKTDERAVAADAETEQALIDRWIVPDAMEPAQMRLAECGIHVWAIIGASGGLDEYIRQVADDYAVPIDAVRAAHAYYRRHLLQIDARLEANAVFI